jgi:hypothetical protein
LAAVLLGAAALAAAPMVAEMQWDRRVLLVSAPSNADSALLAQPAVFVGMGQAAVERDLRLVSIAGETVDGAGDTAASLRQRYRLPDDRFAVVLLGKDGGVKLRGAAPLSAEQLIGVIDAMPMRRAEQR